MRKFIHKTLFFVIYAFSIQIAYLASADPFNIFHTEQRNTGFEVNQHYIKVKYILNNPEKFDGFIFGGSRVGALRAEKMPGRVFNMTYNGGLPCLYLDNLKTFTRAKIFPKKVYMCVDSLAYTNSSNRIGNHSQCPYEFLMDHPEYFFKLYLNPFAPVITPLTDRYKKRAPSQPFNWNTTLWPSIGGSNFMDETLDDIQEIVNLCRRNKIELIIFTNPMHQVTYLASVVRDYFEFLRRLAQITDFYNFSSLNDVTMNNSNYWETSHYKPNVGDMIIDVICNGARNERLYRQGFGMKVTRNNIENLISLLESQI